MTLTRTLPSSAALLAIEERQTMPSLSCHDLSKTVTAMALAEEHVGEARSILSDTRAVLSHHFRLRSYGHSSLFLQFSRIAQYPCYLRRVCGWMLGALNITASEFPTVVLTPHKAGMHLGVGLVQALNAWAAENDVGQRARHVVAVLRKDEDPRLAGGHQIDTGELVLIANDIATTGTGLDQLRSVVAPDRRVLAAVFLACRRPLCSSPSDADRVADQHGIGRFLPLLFMNADYYAREEDCPLCARGVAYVEADDLN